MSNVIPFPTPKEPSAFELALDRVRQTYVAAGLNAADAEAALAEFKPYLEQFAGRREVAFMWPEGVQLSEEHQAAIIDEHMRCVTELFEQEKEEVSKALNIIAGLIARQYAR